MRCGLSAGGSGGILMPVIICGGTMGYVLRGLIYALFQYECGQVAIVLGMASFFAALTRLPLTATILSCEMSAILTVDENLIFPILLAAIVSSRLAGLFQHCTVFERMMLQDGINPLTIGEQIHKTVQIDRTTKQAMIRSRRSAIAPDDLTRASLAQAAASRGLADFLAQRQRGSNSAGWARSDTEMSGLGVGGRGGGTSQVIGISHVKSLPQDRTSLGFQIHHQFGPLSTIGGSSSSSTSHPNVNANVTSGNGAGGANINEEDDDLLSSRKSLRIGMSDEPASDDDTQADTESRPSKGPPIKRHSIVSKKHSLRSSIHSLLSPSPSLFTSSPSVVQFTGGGQMNPGQRSMVSDNVTLLYRAMEHKAQQASRRASRNSTVERHIGLLRGSTTAQTMPASLNGGTVGGLLSAGGVGGMFAHQLYGNNASSCASVVPSASSPTGATNAASPAGLTGGSSSSSSTQPEHLLDTTGLVPERRSFVGHGPARGGMDQLKDMFPTSSADMTIFRFLTSSAQQAVRNSVASPLPLFPDGLELPSGSVSFPPSSSIPEVDESQTLAAVEDAKRQTTLLQTEDIANLPGAKDDDKG
ncbi:unnamed protein product [Amoebophrya sp. A25]|nr:unnamed protein product [Amoebophrya sp. A25]|eukprot:GSA25T00004316001.1